MPLGLAVPGGTDGLVRLSDATYRDPADGRTPDRPTWVWSDLHLHHRNHPLH